MVICSDQLVVACVGLDGRKEVSIHFVVQPVENRSNVAGPKFTVTLLVASNKFGFVP